MEVIVPHPHGRDDDRLLLCDCSLEVRATAPLPLFIVLKDFHGGLAALVTD